MKVRTSASAVGVRTFRPEVLRLEDRIVPGEVLGTAMFWAMGSLAGPALIAQDHSEGMSIAWDREGASASSATLSDNDASSYSVCQVDDADCDALDSYIADTPANDTDTGTIQTDVSDAVFAHMGPSSDSADSFDSLSQPALSGGGMNYSGFAQSNAAQMASGSSAGVMTPAVSTGGNVASIGGDGGVNVGAAVSAFVAANPGGGSVTLAQPSASHGQASTSESIVSAPSTSTTSVQSTASSTTVTAAAPTASADTNTADASAVSDGGTAVPLMVAHTTASPNSQIHPNAAGGAAPFSPAQIQQAYGLNLVSNQGAGQTIYIVDAYNDPNISSDLATFDAQWGLSNPTLTVHKMSSYMFNSTSWGLEESLDVEWAHAIAPQANITLVEATSASNSALYSAVDWATNHGAHIVSMSFGGGDTNAYDSHFNHSGVTYIASSGDTGAAVEYPASSPYVLAVGGTSLTLDSNNNYVSESAWTSGGGGTSSYEARPGYQTNYGLTYSGRSTPDVAFDADPNTGVYVYDSYTYTPGWYEVGGTSLSAPSWAGIIARADQGRSTPLSTNNLTSRTEYNAATGSVYSSNYHDITTGSNGHSAGPGYDQATGVGSPIANNLIPWLISHN